MIRELGRYGNSSNIDSCITCGLVVIYAIIESGKVFTVNVKLCNRVGSGSYIIG